MKIVADVHIPFVKEYFGIYGELIMKTGRTIARPDVEDADILLVRSVTHVDEKLLTDTSVKFVGSVTAGADHLDTKWLDEVGIAWSVAVGFNAPPVADYVVSVVAALQSKGLLTNKQRKACVIGVGNVGKLVVERLKLLNFDVTLCDPIRAEHEKDFLSLPFQELTDFDLISLHVPLTKSGKHPTHHFIDKDFLLRQKSDCILLNASRGAVINSQHLLQYGTHLLWCFDVWEFEPKIEKTILEKTIIATPHIAGYSVQSKMRGIDIIYRIACEKNLIPQQVISPRSMQKQQLSFADGEHTWQSIVLGTFNPLVITAMMKTILLPAADYAHLFDEIRNAFNYRYEFKYTMLNTETSKTDKQLLKKLGFTF